MPTPPVRRLFVANRGEVAVRVARTCDRLGVEPVFAVSEADASLPCYAERETVVVGASRPQDSYLRKESMVQAALQSDCGALHPGWGFLSEDPQFAALCEAHGVTFLGPPPAVMQLLGRKSAAKEVMRRHGVPVIPGSHGVVATVDEAATVAERTGYPVLVKAESGGGGRGMRVVGRPEQLTTAFQEATREAQGAFGDGRLYLERFIPGGRHVELQLLADRYGNVVSLGERDCSVQRNHQKLIEESPAPNVSPQQLDQVTAAAKDALRALGYVGAGTVEFLLTDERELLFLEVNARLQVEHGVTELRTGVDLVEEQLRVGLGFPLNLTELEVAPRGASIECRINAEDPDNAFLPSPGRLATFVLPSGEGVRVDTHLEAGAEVTPFYDSLLCKLMTYGEDRAEAIARMLTALEQFRCSPVVTTAEFHRQVLSTETFQRMDHDTSTDFVALMVKEEVASS